MKTLKLLLFVIGLSGFAAASSAQQLASGTDTNGEAQVVRVARAQSDAAASWNWTVGTERQLASEPGSPTVAALPQAVHDAEDAHAKKLAELERLARQLAELRAAVQANTETNANADQLIREWESKLAAAKLELAELARKEAELMRQLTEDAKSNGLATGVEAGERKPIAVMVRNGFVAPLERPYFHGRSVRWTDGDSGVEIIADQDGVPLGQALESGGWLAKALDAADPQKAYCNIIISSDSISAYYALLKELRQRKLLHRWGTWDGKSVYFITQRAGGNGSSSSGTKVW